MIKVIADDKIPFLKGVLETYADVSYLSGKQISNEILKDTDALLVRTRTKCTKELLKETNVRFVGTATIGYDHIDTNYCEDHGIFWTNAPGCNSSSVMQYIASALLRISLAYRFNLADKTIGIIGVGNVGSKVEKFARNMGMKILLCDPPRAKNERTADFTTLERLLKDSDIVTLHVPLNKSGEHKTYHLFDNDIFKEMKKGSWLINSSRGEVVDTSALKSILKSGRLGGAVIDVWENEPDIDLELMNSVFIATPHIAGYSTDGKSNGTAMIVNALSEYFNLPLKNWYPGNVPLPTEPVIEINGSGKSTEEIFRNAINHTYDIGLDDKTLRASPTDFEKQRGDYRIRREFSAFTINLNNVESKVISMAKEMGFILTSYSG
jgi:erythronate-4-phosphate dehydrogenase